MTVLIKNNAVGKIAGSVDSTQTIITLQAGSGGGFPSPGEGEWFPITLEAIAGGSVTREIVYCTERSGDTLTVQRGMEGTAPETFSAGDRAELRFTQGVFDMLAQITGQSGEIRIPSGTTAERSAAPGSGLFRFNTDTEHFEVRVGGAWLSLPYITSPTGSIRIPSGTTAERDPSPGSDKLLRFNTDTLLYEGYNGSEWLAVGSGAKGGGGDQVFIENDQVVTQDYTIPGNKNAMSTGPITINDGVTVTVSDGARWVIL